MKPQTAAAFTEPQTTAASRQPPCVWPLDSTIEDYMGLARKYSEGVDQVLMDSFAVVSGLCSHATFTSISADGVPQPLLVSPTGMRKTTTLQLVTHIARNLLPKEAFVHGVTSSQALFLEYLAQPDKLWLIDEDDPGQLGT